MNFHASELHALKARQREDNQITAMLCLMSFLFGVLGGLLLR